MNILIGTKYRLATIPCNFVIEKRTIAGKKAKILGKVVWERIGYYSTIEGALRGLLRNELLECNAKSISELKALVASVREDIALISDELMTPA